MKVSLKIQEGKNNLDVDNQISSYQLIPADCGIRDSGQC